LPVDGKRRAAQEEPGYCQRQEQRQSEAQ
jgi:hypothetical protein